jgi:hypothetical protein
VATVSAEGRGGVDGATPLSRSGVASEPIGEFVVGAGARIDRQATPDSTVTQEPRSAQGVRVTEIRPARTTAGALIYRSIAASDGTDPVAASRGIQRPAFAGTNGAWQSDSGGPGSGDEATHGSAAGQVELASVYAIARADAPDSDGEPRTPAAAGASGPGVTEAAATAVETMAHEVYGLLRRRLIVERERSGLRAAWLRD